MQRYEDRKDMEVRQLGAPGDISYDRIETAKGHLRERIFSDHSRIATVVETSWLNQYPVASLSAALSIESRLLVTIMTYCSW